MSSDVLSNLSKTSSWISSVEEKSRESLYRTCAGWGIDSTDALIGELESSFLSNKALLSHQEKDIIKAIDILNQKINPMLSALTAGIFLIER